MMVGLMMVGDSWGKGKARIHFRQSGLGGRFRSGRGRRLLLINFFIANTFISQNVYGGWGPFARIFIDVSSVTMTSFCQIFFSFLEEAPPIARMGARHDFLFHLTALLLHLGYSG